jgi:hypothetical protein
MNQQPRQHLRLIVTKSADGHRAIKLTGERPVFFGAGEYDYVCGACAAILCPGMKYGHLAGLTAICRCGAINRVPEREEHEAAA